MAGRGKARRAARAALLEELKAVAGRLGIQVREERLLREVGYHARSGRCRVRDTELVILERGLPVDVHLEVLAEALADRSLETTYLSPAARAFLTRTGGRPTSLHGGEEDLRR